MPEEAPGLHDRTLPASTEKTGMDKRVPHWAKSVSIFFPMYNERENLPRLLAQLEEVLPTLGLDDFEVLFIDDGSTDGSAELIEGFARSWQERGERGHFRVVRHEQNRGYGAALRTGFLSARMDAVFYTDSDLPVDLAELRRALRAIGQADLVIGYRIDRRDSVRRAIYSRAYNRLMRALFGVRVRDVNFSFKLVRRSAIEQIRLTAGTVFIDGQLLAEARQKGLRIVELPIEYLPRSHGHSSFDSPRVALATLVEMLRYRLGAG